MAYVYMLVFPDYDRIELFKIAGPSNIVIC